MENSDHFRTIAKHYDNYRVSHEHFSTYISSKYKINPNSVLIDVGCGTGNETLALFNKLGCYVKGIDPSEEMLKKAMEKSDRISWLKASAEEIPLANGCCNIITVFFSVHYFINILHAINEFSRILQPNGRVFIFTMSHKQLKTIKEYEFFPSLLKYNIDKLPNIKFIESIFKTKGFKTSVESLFYQNIAINENYIEMVKNRYRLSFYKISDKEIKSGIELIKKELFKKGPWMEKVYCTLIMAEKQIF